MGTVTRSANNVSIRLNGDNDKRDITDLWAEALSEYDGIVGFDLKPTFVNVESMIANGEKAMNDFHRFRHDQKKVDKLRSIFSVNMSLIEKGAKQLVEAATPAFPPAAAIGTALTFVLSACKKVSADYDVVTAFFEDMNNFLQRVTILVKRSPQNAVWQKALLNVFTSFLKMCGFAHKYIEKGRFRKWVTNAVFGEDSDLAGSRKGMDAALSKLHAATEFATLGNTEELKQMNDELRENQEAQKQLSESQSVMLQTLLDQQSSLQDDMKKLMQYLEQQKKEDKGKSKTVKAQNKATANRVKTVLPEVLGVEAEVQAIRKSFVSDTAKWIFEEEAWKTWSAIQSDLPCFLMVRGPPGIGKSHLAVSISDHLRKVAAEEDANHVTVTHFFCREANDDLKYCCWLLISLVLQISEHNLDLRDRLEAILAKESEEVDIYESWDIWSKLLVPLFGSDSKHRLIIVIDGLDELDDDDQRTELLQCAKDAQKKGLKIKMVCTARADIEPEFDVPGLVHIDVDKEKVVPDLQRIVWNRMQNHATDYRGLTRFSKYVKQRIASRIEETADGLLYTEHMLRYLGRMSREAAVIKELEEAMPKDITDLFITMLSQSQRRTPTGLFGAIKSFLAWVSFCFRPLTLVEANQVVNADIRASTRRTGRIERFDLEEEIQITYSRFLQIGSSISEAPEEMFSPTTMMKGFSLDSVTSTKPVFDDGGLEIKFRERSMREFFSSAAEGEESLRMPSSSAHKNIFMACYRIIRTWAATSDAERSSQSKSLYEYALQYCIQHWMSIDFTKHSTAENVEVAQAFASLLTDRVLLATGLESLGENNVLHELTELFFDDWMEELDKWRKWFEEEPTLKERLNDRARKYWTTDPKDAALPVARSHVENWFAAPDITAARKSYRFARGAIAITNSKNLLDPDFKGDEDVDDADDLDQDEGAEENKSKDEILGIFNAFDIKKTSNAYFAVAVILNLRGNRAEAAEMMEIAIEMCHEPAEQFRNYEFLAYIYWELSRSEEALYFVDLSLGSADGIPSSTIIKAYVTRARALAQQDRHKEAAESFRKARLHDLEQVPTGRTLFEEMITYQEEKDYSGLMSVLQEWRAIERLTFMTYNYAWDEWQEPPTITPLYVAAMECNKVDQLIEILEEVIQSLEIENSSAPLRNVLGLVHWRLRGDVQTAKAVFNIVLLNTTEGYGYALTDQAPSDAAWKAANMMSDILYQEFQASSDPAIKTSLYEEVKSLRQKPLLQSVQIVSSNVVAYLLVLARMAQKIGPTQEFERVMKQAFDNCLEGLGDTVSINDSVSTNHMARVLYMMGMHRDAEIFHSAQFYVLDSNAEDAEPAEGETEDGNDQADDDAEGAVPDDDDDDDEDDEAENGTIDANTPQTPRSGRKNGHTNGIDDLTDQIDGMLLDHENHNAKATVNEDGNTDDPATETGETEGEETAYDLNEDALLQCTGMCMPMRIAWQSWDIEETGPMYQCLYCTGSRLCQSCYETRLRYNEEGRKENEPDFCCNNGQYLTGPIEGWKGIKDGVIYIEGEEPKKFSVYVAEVEARWKERWTEFWRG